LTSSPSSATAGSGFSAAVAVQDQFGNAVSSTASITLSSSPAGVSGILTLSAAGGVASFSGLILQTAGPYTLGAASAGLTPGNSTQLTVTAGQAAGLAFSQQPPTSITAGNGFAVAVSVQDSFGNTVTGSTASVSLSATGLAGASP